MIHILYCGNKGVFDGILTSVLSILRRTETKEPFTFYIYTMDKTDLSANYVPIGKEEEQFLQQIVCRYNSENQVRRIPVDSLYQEEFEGCPNESAYCSPYTLLRLLADRVEEMPDKLLYLDADVMLNRDVRLLYDIDIQDYEYAAAKDHYGKYLVHPNYINAGVLLLNMKKIRSEGLFQNARDWLRKRKLLFADQSALIRATTKKKMLPQRFNDQKFLHKNTVIRHFSKRLFYLPYPHTDNIKQWQVSKIHKIFRYYCFDDILYEYIYLKKKFENEVHDHVKA